MMEAKAQWAVRERGGEPAVERYLDALNRHLLDGLQHGGEAFVSNAIVNSRFVLRGPHVVALADRGLTRRVSRGLPPDTCRQTRLPGHAR
jgi:hypothetical protein